MENNRETFKIGDEIVSKIYGETNDGVAVREGSHHIVSDVRYCSGCGQQYVCISGDRRSLFSAYVCGDCKDTFLSKHKPWIQSKHFIFVENSVSKILNLEQQLERAIEVEDYALAVLIRDQIKANNNVVEQNKD